MWSPCWQPALAGVVSLPWLLLSWGRVVEACPFTSVSLGPWNRPDQDINRDASSCHCGRGCRGGVCVRERRPPDLALIPLVNLRGRGSPQRVTDWSPRAAEPGSEPQAPALLSPYHVPFGEISEFWDRDHTHLGKHSESVNECNVNIRVLHAAPSLSTPCWRQLLFQVLFFSFLRIYFY